MGGACRRRAPHPVLSERMPEGVGRLDCWSCPVQVRSDVTNHIARWIEGGPDRARQQPNTLFEWVAGPHLNQWGDKRRDILAEHIADYVWRQTEETGGFVIGATDKEFALGGVMLVSLMGGRSATKGWFDQSSHIAEPGRVPWKKFGNAKPGVRQRLRALRQQLDQHDRDMDRPHVFVRMIAYSTHQMHMDQDTPEDDSFSKLMAVITDYADRRLLPVYTQTADLQDVRALEKHDFRLLEQFDFMAPKDPDPFYSLRAVSTMTREPKSRRGSPQHANSYWFG